LICCYEQFLSQDFLSHSYFFLSFVHTWERKIKERSHYEHKPGTISSVEYRAREQGIQFIGWNGRRTQKVKRRRHIYIYIHIYASFFSLCPIFILANKSFFSFPWITSRFVLPAIAINTGSSYYKLSFSTWFTVSYFINIHNRTVSFLCIFIW
jgi:hypothetical protein